MSQAAVIYAQQLDRLVAFYTALGHVVTEAETGDFAVLRGSGGELSIVQVPEHIASRIEISIPPKVRTDTPIKLSFVVRSIDDTLAAMAKLGGTTDDDFERWEFRGQIIQDVVDPEGNVFQLRQSNVE